MKETFRLWEIEKGRPELIDLGLGGIFASVS